MASNRFTYVASDASDRESTLKQKMQLSLCFFHRNCAVQNKHQSGSTSLQIRHHCGQGHTLEMASMYNTMIANPVEVLVYFNNLKI